MGEITVKGGSTVTLNFADNNNIQSKNFDAVSDGPLVVEGVPPAPNAFDGGFVQIDVVSVSIQ